MNLHVKEVLCSLLSFNDFFQTTQSIFCFCLDIYKVLYSECAGKKVYIQEKSQHLFERGLPCMKILLHFQTSLEISVENLKILDLGVQLMLQSSQTRYNFLPLGTKNVLPCHQLMALISSCII